MIGCDNKFETYLNPSPNSIMHAIIISQKIAHATSHKMIKYIDMLRKKIEKRT